MYKDGNIIYFTPFYFKNGKSSPKPKYFIVLKTSNNGTLLASLPTRKDSIPEDAEIENGCVELPNVNVNCFVISKDLCVTICEKKFDFSTFIYGHQIDQFNVKLMEEIYPIENTDYEIWGIMKPDIFKELIDCFKTSDSVKMKYIRILNQ